MFLVRPTGKPCADGRHLSRANGCYCAVAINCIKERSERPVRVREWPCVRPSLSSTVSLLPTALKGERTWRVRVRVAETAAAHAHCAAYGFFFLLLGIG